MSVHDWKDRRLAEAWLAQSKDYGDLYRQLLVNPIIHELLSGPTALSSVTPLFTALDNWYTRHGEKLRSSNTIPRDWYEQWGRQNRPRADILDIGCGDAYRGRWLAGSKSITYVGVDGSSHLLEAEDNENRRFRLEELDVDTNADRLPGIWQSARPPKWVFLVTVLDHLSHPERLLRELAQMYMEGDSGYLLVVTCHSRFYREQPNHPEPKRVSIASLPRGEGDVNVYFRSRSEMRRLFRDAGMQVLDELTPPLPKIADKFGAQLIRDARGLIPPLHFWLLRADSTHCTPVDATELEAWSAEVARDDRTADGGTSYLLKAVIPHVDKLHWRHLSAGTPLVCKYNFGGRIFIVRDGQLELHEFEQNSPHPSDKAQPRLRFLPNEYLGELETYRERRERGHLYSMYVYATRDRADSETAGSRVLEIPGEVVLQLMADPRGLGNPMFMSLKNKLQETLVTYRNHSLSPADTNMKPGQDTSLSGRRAREFKPNVPQQPKRDIVLAAALLSRALERDQDAYASQLRRVVYIKSASTAVEQLFDKSGPNMSNMLNAAFDFLQRAGVIRCFKGMDPDIAGLYPENARQGQPGYANLQSIVQTIEANAGLSTHVAQHCRDPEKEAVYKDLITSQAYRMFVIDDEMMLKRCVLAPSEPLFRSLEGRFALFGNQPPHVKKASFEDAVVACLHHLLMRFDRDIWKFDSVGFSTRKKQGT
jgi:2-polyprenyl-3-methyl-5-hydroxy-6-metoxy-1,4-benzoquinol methylase